MVVTMREIDVLRERAAALQTTMHACIERRGGADVPCGPCQGTRAEIQRLTNESVRLLQAWWAQGCREVPVDSGVPCPGCALPVVPHTVTIRTSSATWHPECFYRAERGPSGFRFPRAPAGFGGVSTYPDAGSKNPHPVRRVHPTQPQTCIDCGLIFDARMISAHVIFCPARKS